jgi:nucleoid-associated protein YgaU
VRRGPRGARALRTVAACLLAALGGVPAAAAPPTVVVERGDTLAKIAERTLGDAALWPVLYRANRDRIKDPARVYPGQELTVPPADEVRAAPRDEAPGAEAP